MLSFAELHNVQGIIAHIIKKHRSFLKPDEEILDLCDQLLYSTVILSTTKKYSYDHLITMLDNEKIPRVLMKGIVIRDYYPIPDFRLFTDIEFLIKKDDREKSNKLMVHLGYHLRSSRKEFRCYQKQPEYYVFYTQIQCGASGKIKQFLENAWDHAEPDGGYSYRFAPEFHLIYLLIYLARRLLSCNAVVRMLLDIALLIRYEDLDWEDIRKTLVEIEFTVFASSVFSLCSRWFGCKTAALTDIPEQTLDELEAFLLVSGTHAMKYIPGAECNLTDDSSLEKSRYTAVIELIFPPYRSISLSYPAVKAFPPLLPVVWFYRGIKGLLFKRKSCLAALRSISDKSADSIAHQSLFEKIGINSKF